MTFIYLDSDDIFVGPIMNTQSQTLEQLKKYYKSHNGNFNFSVDGHLQTYTFTQDHINKKLLMPGKLMILSGYWVWLQVQEKLKPLYTVSKDRKIRDLIM